VAYATVAEVRALDGLADVTVYPDATLQQGIDYATALIDGYCGTSFEAKSFTVTLDGNSNAAILTPIMFIRTITSVTVDGISVNVANVYGRSEGYVVRKDGDLFDYSDYGANVVISGTAGVTTTPPEEIKWAARTIARDYCLSLHSRIPSRALTIQNEFGQVEVRAQAGGPGRPTALPDVNAVLNKSWNKHKAGMGGRVIS
jgi:hypothetical protein